MLSMAELAHQTVSQVPAFTTQVVAVAVATLEAEPEDQAVVAQVDQAVAEPEQTELPTQAVAVVVQVDQQPHQDLVVRVLLSCQCQLHFIQAQQLVVPQSQPMVAILL